MVDTKQYIKALRSDNQSILNKAIAFDRKYHQFVDIQNRTAKIERLQEGAFDKFLELFSQLPKYERLNAANKYVKIFGYDLID